MVAVHKYINSEHKENLESKSKAHNKMVIVELTQKNNNKIGLLPLYRPPGDLNYNFNQNLKHDLEQMWDNGVKEIMVIGNLNFPDNWKDGYPPNRNGLNY